MRTLTFRRWLLVTLAALGVLVVVIFFASTLGRGLGFSESLSTIFSPGQEQTAAHQIVWRVRLPRVFLAVIVGAALSIAGASFQAILRNPLAEPYILGISSGGALGAIVSVFLGLHFVTIAGSRVSVLPLFAFCGCLATMFLVYALAFSGRGYLRHSLILTGVIVGAFLSAFVLFFTSLVDMQRLPSVIYWLMGNLNRPLEDVSLWIIWVYVMAGAVALFLLARSFNTLALGDETAHSLGTDPARTRRFAFIAGSLVVSAAVASCGLIGFVGLIIPHTARLALGSDNRLLLPVSFLLGGAFLAGADTVARVLIRNQELPVGVITALCGAPVFLVLMRTRMKESYFG
jgi:iron complex transport system permease protein